MQRQKKAAHLRRLFFGRNLLEGQSFGFDSPLELLHAGFDHLARSPVFLPLRLALYIREGRGRSFDHPVADKNPLAQRRLATGVDHPAARQRDRDMASACSSDLAHLQRVLGDQVQEVSVGVTHGSQPL